MAVKSWDRKNIQKIWNSILHSRQKQQIVDTTENWAKIRLFSDILVQIIIANQ